MSYLLLILPKRQISGLLKAHAYLLTFIRSLMSFTSWDLSWMVNFIWSLSLNPINLFRIKIIHTYVILLCFDVQKFYPGQTYLWIILFLCKVLIASIRPANQWIIWLVLTFSLFAFICSRTLFRLFYCFYCFFIKNLRIKHNLRIV